MELLPWIDKQLNTLAWDIPLGFCSVFVPVCLNPCCTAATAPEQLHLALSASPSEVTITWVTLNDTATSTVQWGAAEGGQSPLPYQSSGFVKTYTFGGWVGVLHEATITNLEPGLTYTYRVGDEAGGWSAAYNFSTLPFRVGSVGRPLRIVQIGDMAYDNTSDATVADITALVEQGLVDLVLHIGDIGYADGT